MDGGEDGRWAAAFVATRPGAPRLLYVHRGEASVTRGDAPTLLSDDVRTHSQVRGVGDGWVVAWCTDAGGSVRAASVPDDPAQPILGTVVHSPGFGGPSKYVDVTRVDEASLVFSWRADDGSGGGPLLARRSVAGLDFAEPEVVLVPAGAGPASLAAHPDVGVVAAYIRERPRVHEVRVEVFESDLSSNRLRIPVDMYDTRDRTSCLPARPQVDVTADVIAVVWRCRRSGVGATPSEAYLRVFDAQGVPRMDARALGGTWSLRRPTCGAGPRAPRPGWMGRRRVRRAE